MIGTADMISPLRAWITTRISRPSCPVARST
jgi:hypothetical protein